MPCSSKSVTVQALKLFTHDGPNQSLSKRAILAQKAVSVLARGKGSNEPVLPPALLGRG